MRHEHDRALRTVAAESHRSRHGEEPGDARCIVDGPSEERILMGADNEKVVGARRAGKLADHVVGHAAFVSHRDLDVAAQCDDLRAAGEQALQHPTVSTTDVHERHRIGGGVGRR